MARATSRFLLNKSMSREFGLYRLDHPPRGLRRPAPCRRAHGRSEPDGHPPQSAPGPEASRHGGHIVDDIDTRTSECFERLSTRSMSTRSSAGQPAKVPVSADVPLVCAGRIADHSRRSFERPPQRHQLFTTRCPGNRRSWFCGHTAPAPCQADQGPGALPYAAPMSVIMSQTSEQ
jgi:hypothetical protein